MSGSKSDEAGATRSRLGGLGRMALAAAEAAKAAGDGELDEAPLQTDGQGAPLVELDDDDDDLELADEDAELVDIGGPDLPDKLYFRIGEVAQLVGVDAHVLRYWESEFRMKPHRSASGQRLYRKDDLARFLRIRHLLHDEGYTIAGARRVLSGTGEGGGGVDPAQLRAVLDRLASLRANIRDFRDDIEHDL